MLNLRKSTSSETEKTLFLLVAPCQAYPFGRSRKLVEAKLRTIKHIEKILSAQLVREFYKDKRHTLYLEYLNILCRYQSVFFIMENEGYGSARSGVGESIGSVLKISVSVFS